MCVHTLLFFFIHESDVFCFLNQTGKYGKITKCITFPAMLDMIPFMTGTGDSPPLYMLYGVVVHLDSLNASFSGHYVSYVKDLQDSWFRIDDTVVILSPHYLCYVLGVLILLVRQHALEKLRFHTFCTKNNGNDRVICQMNCLSFFLFVSAYFHVNLRTDFVEALAADIGSLL